MDYVRKFCSLNLLKRTSSLTHITHSDTWPGYGMFPLTGIGKQQNMCVVEDLEHALVYNWNGDNDGPSADPNVYEQRWNEISHVFPNAEIIPSTFDNFTQHLDQGKDKFPVIKAEAGDVSNYSISLNLIKTTSSLTHYSFRRGYMVSRVTHKKFLE